MLKVNAARPECPRKHVDDWLRGALGKPWNRQKRFPKLLFLLYVTGSLAAVFYLPYQFPTSPSTSESWIFGYNNRAGEILVLVTVLLESTKTNDRIFAAVLTVICTAFMFLFSPETPIALSFAGVCLYILSVPKWTRQLSAILASEVFILCALFWSVFHTPVYDTIKTDSAGANSFPIVLSPPILFFLATVFFAGCYVYRRLEQQSLNDDCFALVVYSIPMLAAALGRCDPGHLASNGQGLILVSMFSISVFEVPWRRYRVVYVVFMFLLPSLTGLAIFANQLGQVSSLNAADADPNMRTDLLEKTFPTWTGKFMVPFGFRPNGIGTYLSARIDYGRFDGTQNLNTIDGVTEIVNNINSHPEEALILPAAFVDICRVNQTGEKLVMSLLFDTVFIRPVAHSSSIRKPICDKILADYEIVQPAMDQSFGYRLWVRKPLKTQEESSTAPVASLN